MNARLSKIIAITLFIFISNLQADLGSIYTSGDANTILAPATITSPGNYRLARDISGPIVIASDNVNIDLENHVLTGQPSGITASSQANITIKNGVITGASQAGVFISTCT